MWNIIIKILPDLANWLEVIGFAIIIVTAIKVFLINKDVKKLNSKHLFQTRIEGHIKDLKKTSTNFSKLLGDYKSNIKEIRIEVSMCHINCLSIRKKVNKSDLICLSSTIDSANCIMNKKVRINKNRNRIILLKKHKYLDDSDIDSFYINLTSLITELEHLIKDNKKILK